ncbi:hypothetical protein CPB84DRAFT_1849832 [Gymnopilus junonius]|uniref:Uncharacterized protein n=1 Tax=Gymnopilus junonius TaxID=109634 RepID=A0A9P5NJR8_GYMJU|nr:hypothetical protein CPB84DRAFT_1849832 [Gymnopilus junonius]
MLHQILLVGLPGSGKSTTVKYLRMMYDKEGWEVDRSSWRPVILLNVVQSIIRVVEFVKAGSMDQEASAAVLKFLSSLYLLEADLKNVVRKEDKSHTDSTTPTPTSAQDRILTGSNGRLLQAYSEPFSDILPALNRIWTSELFGSALDGNGKKSENSP